MVITLAVFSIAIKYDLTFVAIVVVYKKPFD